MFKLKDILNAALYCMTKVPKENEFQATVLALKELGAKPTLKKQKTIKELWKEAVANDQTDLSLGDFKQKIIGDLAEKLCKVVEINQEDILEYIKDFNVICDILFKEAL